MKINWLLNSCFCIGLTIVFLLPGTAFSQNVNEPAVKALFKNISDLYQKENIRFDVIYKYADMSNPSHILDSLRGNIQLKGAQFYYNIDNMLTVQNEECSITLFKEEKLMYLSKQPKEETNKKKKKKQAKAMDAILTLIDSVGAKTDSSFRDNNQAKENAHFNLSVSGKYKLVTIDFPKGADFKNTKIYIDSVTGYISKAVYIVRSQQMLGVDPGTPIPANSGMSEYAMVESNYINYSNQDGDISLFDSNHYFSRNGKDIKPAESYKAYKIVIATPNF